MFYSNTIGWFGLIAGLSTSQRSILQIVLVSIKQMRYLPTGFRCDNNNLTCNKYVVLEIPTSI